MPSAAESVGLTRRLSIANGVPRATSRVPSTTRDKNERAVKLYESFGFRRIGTTTFKAGAEVMEDLVPLLDKTQPRS
jgi:uncharacterized protein YaaQ